MQSAIANDSDGMVVIDSGSYTPLFKSESGPNKIQVDAFALDVFPVTNREYYLFSQENARWSKTDIKPVFADQNYLVHLSNDALLEEVGNQPVTNISWFSARAFCKSKGKRLPTTDEWELAAQASHDKANGSEDPEYNQTILEWYSKPASASLPNVKETEANFWGVHGMHGVVWELVNDFNTSLVTGESRADSQLDKQLFCGAGAASSVNPNDYAAFMRYALRSSYQASYTMTSLGFRCAQDIEKGIEKESGKIPH